MRCPTCGRSIRRGQEVCPNCGGLVRDADLAEDTGKSAAAGKMAGTAMRTEPPPPAETEEFPGPLEEIEGEEEGLPPAAPETPPAKPPAQPPLKIPALLRILFPLLFILIPVLNFLLRDSSFRSLFEGKPRLQLSLFCEGFSEGRPVNPRTVFSLRRQRQVVLYSRWSGVRGRHSYSFRWYAPDGTLAPASSTVTRFQFGGEEGFATVTVLPLAPGMALGKWQAEIAVDRETQARPSFELAE